MKAKELFEKQQKEMKRIGAEEKSLSGLEISYNAVLKNAENEKRKNSTIGSKLMALVKGSSAQRGTVGQENVINEMRKGLQQIEKRKNEIARIRQKKEIENAQAEANVRKAMANMEKEHTLVQRQQQREWEMQEKEDRLGAEFGSTRLMKRRKR